MKASVASGARQIGTWTGWESEVPTRWGKVSSKRAGQPSSKESIRQLSIGGEAGVPDSSQRPQKCQRTAWCVKAPGRRLSCALSTPDLRGVAWSLAQEARGQSSAPSSLGESKALRGAGCPAPWEASQRRQTRPTL